MDTASGKVVSLSHKCTELDRQLPQLLGVSKPVLEHVLFCHQEDASWPLQEGAVLKKRFDDIFDSTRYTKAIDVFRKTEKDLAAKVKDLKADLAGLSSHRYAAHNFQNELSRHQEQLDHIDEEKKTLHAGIKRDEEQILRADEIIDQVEDIAVRSSARLLVNENYTSCCGRSFLALTTCCLCLLDPNRCRYDSTFGQNRDVSEAETNVG